MHGKAHSAWARGKDGFSKYDFSPTLARSGVTVAFHWLDIAMLSHCSGRLFERSSWDLASRNFRKCSGALAPFKEHVLCSSMPVAHAHLTCIAGDRPTGIGSLSFSGR